MKIRSTLFGALLLCAALVVPTSADTADQGKSKDKKPKDQARQEEQSQADEARAADRGKAAEDTMRMQGLDTDGDGRITRAEWRGNDTSFNQHDKNGDGVLAGA
ncbi:MAG: hypothetical protein ACJ759_09465 [Thermoanaerobaculia bacterium]